MKPGERGAALLTVLMLVSVMAVLAASALERLRLSTRIAANAGAIDQARSYALAAEDIAVTRIGALVDADPARTPVGWAERETSLPLPGGTASVVVHDGGNCFNLNSVAVGQAGQRLMARPAGIAQFEALMQILGIGQGEAEHVAASLADWIDSDSFPLPQGAEDAAYAGGPTPYKTANTLVADSSELRAVAGVTPEIYDKLKPWVCALPVTDLSPINVNTLTPEQAPLLAMLLPDKLSADRARALLIGRPAGGYESGYAFWRTSSLAGMAPGGDVEAQTGVRTRWFALDLHVRLGDSEVDETALIEATVQPARLVRRSWGDGA
ncbi:general secretion pathway protein K [Sphingomonas changbaiensis NBRC 104936]|uniref:Type II secretion system protein K n=1 Tax=Sphingomonas changbaiensis NBRC 104936 TaxID=1219043 RepID=A0A0E9MME3_9SPHN|nr:type II secretion system minor pseudopilin GspK [Sphingomonas changbaiensis]GAO38678.1 general secretion pathway protein K [Sphingomonas changbaiensis NBRC 104936]